MYSYKKLLKLVLTSHIHKKAFGESEIPNIHVLCKAMSDKKSENFNNLHAFAQRGEETHQYKEGKWSSNPNNTNDK